MKITRRTFLKFLAGGAFGLLLSPLPWKGLGKIAALTQPGPLPLPTGKQEFKHSLSSLCPAKTPLKIRLINGQPVQALPWPNHPLGGQGLSALAAAEVQNLFRPSRLKQPLARNSNGVLAPISWQEAYSLLADQLAKVNANGANGGNSANSGSTGSNGDNASNANSANSANSVNSANSASGGGDHNQDSPSGLACVLGDETSVGALVLREFLQNMGSQEIYTMPSQATSLKAAWQLMGGTGQPGYDLENSDYVLSVGADLLESWGPVLRNRRIFFDSAPEADLLGAATQAASQGKCKYVYCGPVQNATALACQQWLAVKPGMEEFFLIALAGSIIQEMPHSLKVQLAKYADFSAFEKLTHTFSAQKLCPFLGISEAQIQKVASQLLLAKHPVVIAASSLGQDASLQLNLLGLALNLLLNNINQPGGLSVLPELAKLLDLSFSSGQNSNFGAYLHKLQLGEKKLPKVLIINDCNPLYDLPAYISTHTQQAGAQSNGEWRNIFQKIPFKVAFSSFMHETVAECDLVFPVPAGLERWDHVYSPFGCGQVIYSLCAPVVNPPKGVKSIWAILDELKLLGNIPRFPKAPQQERDYFEQICRKLGTSCREVENNGYFCTDLQEHPKMLNLKADLLMQLLCDKKNVFEGKTKPTNLVLLPLLRLDLSNANIGLSAYQGFSSGPTPFSRGKQDRATALMNPDSAKLMGLIQGQKIRICREDMPKVGVLAQVCLSNRVPVGGIGLWAGCGHVLSDQFSAGKGQNIMPLFSLSSQAVQAVKGAEAVVFSQASLLTIEKQDI